jgi:glycosyltransferase 2 family protein
MRMTVVARTADQVEAYPDQPPSRQSSWGFTFLKIGLSALAVGLVLHTVDLSAAWGRMAGQDVGYLLAAAGAMMLQICVGGLRWHVILKRLQAPARVLTSLQLFYISAFFNVCLWGAVGGDVVRGWLSYRGKVSARTSINSIVLDRVAALAGVALLVLITAPYWATKFENRTLALLPAGVAAAGLLGIVVLAQFERLPQSWRHLRPMRLVQSLGEATQTIFLRPAAAVPTLLLAITAQALMALSAYFLAQSLSIGLSLIDCLVLMQPVALLTSLPISVGGWGVRETAMIGILGLVGVHSTAALALSVELGLLAMVISAPGLIFWFVLKPKRTKVPSVVPPKL